MLRNNIYCPNCSSVEILLLWTVYAVKFYLYRILSKFRIDCLCFLFLWLPRVVQLIFCHIFVFVCMFLIIKRNKYFFLNFKSLSCFLCVSYISLPSFKAIWAYIYKNYHFLCILRTIQLVLAPPSNKYRTVVLFKVNEVSECD